MYGASIPSSVRISNRERRCRANAAIEQGTRAFLTCLAVLAQKGGEVIVTSATLQQVTSKLDQLDFTVVPNGDTAGEFIVRIIEGDAKDADAIPVESDSRTDGDGHQEAVPESVG